MSDKITVTNKVGFHIGPGGYSSDLDRYFEKLDEADIRFMLKAVDDYEPIRQAGRFSNADHIFLFRLSREALEQAQLSYGRSPEDAAAEHWGHIEAHLPADFDRERVWLEPLNEVDPNRSDWLGSFAVAFADIAKQEELRVLQFAWSSGTPEVDQWETPGMLAYLERCSAAPERLGIALHEYSYDYRNIWRQRGDLIGRFMQLFYTCDRHGHARPTTFISEWGWETNRVPTPEIAIDHIQQVNELYAPFPEIIGAALWYLGGDQSHRTISKQTARLIKPLTDFARNWRLDIEPSQPLNPHLPPVAIPPRPEVEPEDMGGERFDRDPAEASVEAVEAVETSDALLLPNLTFLADETYLDDTEVEQGDLFTKTWRVTNSGQTAWGEGYTLAFVGGDQMGALTEHNLPPTEPGEVAYLSIPLTAPHDKLGTVYTDWRLRDPNGLFFGDVIYCRVTVVHQTGRFNDSAYGADISIPDDTEIGGGADFIKTWEIKNSGTTAWEGGFELAFVGGVDMGHSRAVALPYTDPGKVARVSVEMRAPTVPGIHWADWRPRDRSGNYFGEIVYVRIVVPIPSGGESVPLLSQNDPEWQEDRLGYAGSDMTIGEWGCLVTTFAMIGRYYKKSLDPNKLNKKMVRERLFLGSNLTPWNTLSRLYQDIIFDGRLETRHHPDITRRIDAALRAGNPVAVQVDYTPDSPYVPNDQHWVVVVGREGNDYRVNDPWNYPPSESSFRARYGRPGRPLRDSILSAIFYRTVHRYPPLTVRAGSDGFESMVEEEAEFPFESEPLPLLQTGINIDPEVEEANPQKLSVLKGFDWVRFVFKLDGATLATNRTLKVGLSRYNETIRSYQRQGAHSLVVLNHETVAWEHEAEPADVSEADWERYVERFARVAAQIGAKFKRLRDQIAYEIWPEADMLDSRTALYLPPERYATLLERVAKGIKQRAPEARLLFGGVGSEVETGVRYVAAVAERLDGSLPPLDGLALHPYGMWGTKAPFNWGNHFPPLIEAIEAYSAAFPDLQLWITEIGVVSEQPLDPIHNRAIGRYMTDLFHHMAERHAAAVPVLIWYAWSDHMGNAGIVDHEGQPKPHLYKAFTDVRDKMIF